MSIVIKNISNLVTCEGSKLKKGKEMQDAKIIEDGYVVINEDRITAVGCGEGYKDYLDNDSTIIDGTGKTVTPGLIDCHTHVVYGGSREKEPV
jgi:imidazolonepropionase